VRNHLWTSWLRRPARSAMKSTWRVARRAASDPAARLGMLDAIRGAPAVLPRRQAVDGELARWLDATDAGL